MADACEVVGIGRASYYRTDVPTAVTAKGERPPPPRALSADERERVRHILLSERFIDKAPAQIWATLLDDEGIYLCSIRTMYRILEEHGEVVERRRVRRHPSYARPQLVARGPNQVWSWDITKLPGPNRWVRYHLYVLLDIYSRFVTGWLVADAESSQLAQALILQSCERQNIEPGQLDLHSDRGAAMTSGGVAELLARLGIERSLGRPRTPNDNAFSESQFRTLKDYPTFPDCFGSLEDARGFCQEFFHHYNYEHRHSGILLLTPAQVHLGQAEEALARRQEILDQVFETHPERFVHGAPQVGRLATEVYLTRPTGDTKSCP